MKKLLSLVLCCILSIFLVGCTEDSDSTDNSNNQEKEEIIENDNNTDPGNDNIESNDTDDNLTQEEKDKQQLEKDNPTGYYVTCPECGEKVFTVNGDWDCSHDSNTDNSDVNINPDSQDDDYDPNENNYIKPNASDLGEKPWNQDFEEENHPDDYYE